MEKNREIFQRLPFWEKLTEEQKAYAIQHGSVRHYGKDSLIYDGGSVCLGMACVLKGSIRVSLLSEEGREITLFRLEQGEPCVLSASCVISQITFETCMTAEQDCDLLVIGAGAFRKLTEKSIYVKCFQYELMTERFSSVMWTMQQILFAKMDQRLAGYLVQEYDRTKSADIHMTQEQIAQQINSAREVVTRMLRRFAAEHLVKVKRGVITLLDVEGLRKI
ncbi:MAG: Crp/Fnr family transcriptional regulator [Lachnospiraceae bacterium]|jgi:Cyclic nucleotide-binding domain./Bacterial regulatory proteins, crp family.|nr:Crp/Fnr family transcriptional regulator [Lachnospiraceae bacterium]MCI9659141.1 Crp/Fnr family transcriptional regulator [Lachnospiraceae bacterium]